MKKILIIILTILTVFSNTGVIWAQPSIEFNHQEILPPIATDDSNVILVDDTTPIAPIIDPLPDNPPVIEPLIPDLPIELPIVEPVVSEQPVTLPITPDVPLVEENVVDPAIPSPNHPVTDELNTEEESYKQESNSLNNYKKVAGLSGDLRVDQFSGAAVYTYSLEIPKGRSGLQPALNLYYNSHDKSFDSWVGQGWSLDFGYIQRSAKKGTNNLYLNNDYILSLNGKSYDLISIDAVNNLYGAKVEGDYLKIQYASSTSSWLVIDTLGTKYFFGSTSASRQDNSNNVNQIYKWNLDKVLDTNDNYYQIEYFKNSGYIYPSRILYTGHAQTAGPMEIWFNLENRPDNFFGYSTGFSATSSKRLLNIEVRVLNDLKWKYEFSYQTGQNGSTSLLYSITKKAYQNTIESVLPATTFTYQTKTAGWTQDSTNRQNIFPLNATLVDINADSWIDRGTDLGGVNGFISSNWQYPRFWSNNAGQWIDVGQPSVDINGDKYPDIITTLYAPSWDPQTSQTIFWHRKVYLNNRVNGFVLDDQWTAALPSFITGVHNFEFAKMATVDLNNDGLADLIFAYRSYGTYVNSSITQQVYLNNGHGWSGANYPLPPNFYLADCDVNSFPGCQSTGAQFVDINNDGLVDIQKFNNIYLNTGNGFEQQPNVTWSNPSFGLPQGFSDPTDGNCLRITDLNGDGLVDLVVACAQPILRSGVWVTVEHFAVNLNTGHGWQRQDNWRAPVIFSAGFPPNDLGVKLLDINNDGSMDIVKDYCNVTIRPCPSYATERGIYLGSGNQADLLLTINNGYGATTAIQYQASARFINSNNTLKNPNLPVNLQVVKRITTTDGAGNSLATDYDYQDGYYYRDSEMIFTNNTNYTDNQFVGFGEVTAATGNQIVKTYYHQGGGIDGFLQGEYDDSIYKRGRLYREETWQNASNTLTLLKQTTNKWNATDLGGGRQFVYLDNTVTFSPGANGADSLRQQNQELQDQNTLSVESSGADSLNQVNSLTHLSELQNYMPIAEPQLVGESADGWQKTFYLGNDEVGKPKFRMEVYSGSSQNRFKTLPNPTDSNNGIAPTSTNPAIDTNETGRSTSTVSSLGDGYITYVAPRGDTWVQAMAGNTGTSLDNGSQSARLSWGLPSRLGGYSLSRIFLPFDTSGLPDDITINRARLRLDGSSTNMGASVVNSRQHVNRLELEDFGTVGTTSVAYLDFSDYYPYDRVKTYELSAIGRSWIDNNGWTKLALRSDRDDSTNQTLPTNPDTRNFTIATSEVGSENLRPQLIIDFTYNNVNPGVPSSLQTNNQVNPSHLQTQQPSFSAVYNDESTGYPVTQYQIQVIPIGGNFATAATIIWDSGLQNLATSTPVGGRVGPIQYGGSALPLDGSKYFWRIKFWNSAPNHNEGLWSSGQDYFYMDGSLAPTASTDLMVNNRIQPRGLISAPSFTAIYHDPNPIDSAKWYQIQVSTTGNFATTTWDSGKTLLPNLINNGSRIDVISYNGQTLPLNGQTYYWRIKLWDQFNWSELRPTAIDPNGTEGVWSESAIFSMFNQNNVLDNVNARAVQYHYDQNSGNIIQAEDLGQVDAANNGIFLNHELGDEKNTNLQYAQATEPTSHILSATKQKVVAKPDNTASTTVQTTYDNLRYGQVQKANVTREDLQIGQVQYQKNYNAYGLVTQTIDPLSNITRVNYDANNYYPTSTVNQLNQTTQTVYDLLTGQITRTVDPNGLVEERSYDSFGRLVEIRKSDPTHPTSTLAMERNEYHDTASPAWSKKSIRIDQTNWQDVYTYFDGLGRTMQTREQSLNNNFNVISYQYDNQGNLAKQSIVYQQTGSGYMAPTWSLASQPYTSYTYDAAGRKLTETFQSSTKNWITAYQYDGWNVLVTDPNNHQKKYYYDAHNQLVQVDEYLGEQIYSTHYTYNLLGNIAKIVDSQNNERNFVYDSLGRLISQEDMHRNNSTGFGIWHYQYDDNSNLIRKVDPKGQATIYQYDGLNRVINEAHTTANQSPNNSTTDVVYTYDGGINGLGRLTSTKVYTNVKLKKDFTYDLWGRVINQSGSINNRPYQISTSYNWLSQPASIHYLTPENYSVNYSYNSLGQVNQLSIQEGHGNLQNIINSVSYSPLKQIQQISYTNGMVSVNTYDPLQAFRLVEKQTSLATSTLQHYFYDYDSVGNITRLLDTSSNIAAKNTHYEYDDLDRLVQATVINSANNQNYIQTFVYDAIGNILNKSDVGDYLYQNRNPYQAIRIANDNYVYDLNGNVLADGNNTYAYDYNDRLIKAANGQSSNIFAYDASGQRIYKKVSPATDAANQNIVETYYPSDTLEFDVQNSVTAPLSITKYLMLGNQRIGQVVNHDGSNNLELMLTDHLGSSSVLTDSHGNQTAVYDYYPFGGTRIEQVNQNTDSTSRRYTGQELDKSTDLSYYGARYYDQDAGRFTQQDPVSLKIALANEVKKDTGQSQQKLLSNPQVLNSYAYTQNNPVKYIDPDGKFLFLLPAIPYIFTGLVTVLGAYAAQEVGQSAGYAMEGDYTQSNEHTANAMLAFGATAAVGEWGLVAMSLTNPSVASKINVNNEVKTEPEIIKNNSGIQKTSVTRDVKKT